MLNENNFSPFKVSLIYFITSVFILSFFFENYFKYEFEFLRFSIVELIFVVIFFFTLLIQKFNFIRFIFKFDKNNIFEFIIFTILIFKIIKYSLNFQIYYNLYELLIWLYMLSIYFVFKFYLINCRNLTFYITNSFIAISLIISLHILYSFLLYKLGYESNGFWMIRNTTYYPYAGTSSINFKSILGGYNQVAYLLAPGFLFLLNKFNNKLIIIFLIIFYFIVMYLVKSKFLIIFFGTLVIYIIIKNKLFKKTKSNKIFFISAIIGLFFFYFLITHFLIIDKGIINSSNSDLFKKYYFTDFVISLGKSEIYGSMFLKLKFTAIEIANSYNFLLFNSPNYFNNEIVINNFDIYTDPHSDYFGALANYGIFGFLIFLAIPTYMISEYFKNFNLNNLIYFLLIIMIFIEAFVVDIFHTQFIWIVFAMYMFNVQVKKNIIKK